MRMLKIVEKRCTRLIVKISRVQIDITALTATTVTALFINNSRAFTKTYYFN